MPRIVPIPAQKLSMIQKGQLSLISEPQEYQGKIISLCRRRFHKIPLAILPVR
jgi:hypothetical protein